MVASLERLLISINTHGFFMNFVFNSKRFFILLIVALFMLFSALPMGLGASASSCAAGWLCTVTYSTFGSAWVVKGLTSSPVFTFTFLVFNWCDVINIIPRLVCNNFLHSQL